MTESLPKETRAALDLAGDVIEIVPFHPAATFGAAPNVEDEVGSGGYICTYLDTGDDDDDDDSVIPDEAALRAMIAEHAAMRGGADTRADWIQSANARARRARRTTTISRMKISISSRRTRRTPWTPRTTPVGPPTPFCTC